MTTKIRTKKTTTKKKVVVKEPVADTAKVTITMSIDQAYYVMNALELHARLHIGQFDHLDCISRKQTGLLARSGTARSITDTFNRCKGHNLPGTQTDGLWRFLRDIQPVKYWRNSTCRMGYVSVCAVSGSILPESESGSGNWMVSII